MKKVNIPEKITPRLTLIIILVIGLLLVHRNLVERKNNNQGTSTVYEGLKMTLRVDDTEYRIRDTIQATIRLENVSEQDILINNIFQLHSPQYKFAFEDSQGNYHFLNIYIAGGNFYGPFAFSFLQTKQILDITDPVQISGYIQQPGQYNLVAIYSNNIQPNPNDYVTSDQLWVAWTGELKASIPIKIKN
jgi:hypothetical protein